MNSNYIKLFFISSALLALAACGGSGGGSDSDSPAAPGTVSFGISDAPVDGVTKVVITIDGIELRRKDDDCDDDDDREDCDDEVCCLALGCTDDDDDDSDREDCDDEVCCLALGCTDDDDDDSDREDCDDEVCCLALGCTDDGDDDDNDDNDDRCDDDRTSITRFIDNQNTVQINLLDYQGSDSKVLVENIELPAGEYGQLTLSVIDDDINFSYVEEQGGAHKPIKVPGNKLKLGGFSVESGGVQVFVIEFDLRKAMTYNPGKDRYILKPRGVRVVEVEAAASVAGSVASSLFNGTAPCVDKVDPLLGNVVYVYQGHDLVVANLADNFDSSNAAANEPANAIEPYASQTVAADGSYGIAYLPAGDYTLAFSCAAANDDPEVYNGLVIPSPASQIVELSLSNGEDESCNFPVEDNDC